MVALVIVIAYFHSAQRENPSNLSAGHYLNNFSSVVELRRINFHSHIELNIA